MHSRINTLSLQCAKDIHTKIATLFIDKLEILAIRLKNNKTLLMDILEIQHKDRHFINGCDGPHEDR